MTTIQVYPRGCGGTAQTTVVGSVLEGLSPRVRGNPTQLGRDTAYERSIPAGAGEPKQQTLEVRLCRVYPRGCGGTDPMRDSFCRRCAVYPRGCGGTFAASTAQNVATGLSPRVRGNHRRPAERPVDGGSIPAGAGEPMRRGSTERPTTVYPRGCGGTSYSVSQIQPTRGLSPRVRGNRCEPPAPAHRLRSIPAGAGEPG